MLKKSIGKIKRNLLQKRVLVLFILFVLIMSGCVEEKQPSMTEKEKNLKIAEDDPQVKEFKQKYPNAVIYGTKELNNTEIANLLKYSKYKELFPFSEPRPLWLVIYDSIDEGLKMPGRPMLFVYIDRFNKDSFATEGSLPIERTLLTEVEGRS